MKLYMSVTSPYARKVRIFARETGLAARIEEIPASVSPVAPDERVSRANPLGKVPALLLDDGSALFDSAVICEYLDGLHAGRRLFPQAGPARWAALKLQAEGNGLLDASVLARYELALRPEPLRWPEWIAGQKAKVTGVLDALESAADTLAGEPHHRQHHRRLRAGLSRFPLRRRRLARRAAAARGMVRRGLGARVAAHHGARLTGNRLLRQSLAR